MEIPELVRTLLVRSSDLLLSVFDQSFYANRAGEYRRLFDEDRGRIGELPEQLLRLAESDDCLVWMLINDGVYKIETRVQTSPNLDDFVGESAQDFLGSSVSPRQLRSSSGKIVVGSPYDFGSKDQNVITVVPGIYYVGLRWNLIEEQKHWFLENMSSYPVNDGPDGVICLARIN